MFLFSVFLFSVFSPPFLLFCLHQGCNISSQHSASSSALCVCVCVCVCACVRVCVCVCVCCSEGFEVCCCLRSLYYSKSHSSLYIRFFCTLFFLLSLSFLLYLSLIKSYSSLYSTTTLKSSLQFALLPFSSFHILFIPQLSPCSLFLALSLFLTLFFFGKVWAVKALFMNRTKNRPLNLFSCLTNGQNVNNVWPAENVKCQPQEIQGPLLFFDPPPPLPFFFFSCFYTITMHFCINKHYMIFIILYMLQ